MRPHASGTALIGPISGKSDIGDAAPAGAASQAAHSGGTGQPSGPTMGSALRGLDATGTKGGGSRPDGGPEGHSFPPGSTAPADRTPRWRAERRHVPETVRDYVQRRADWRAIPSICEGEERSDGLPGAAKNTGGLARPLLSHARRRGGIRTNRELLYDCFLAISARFSGRGEAPLTSGHPRRSWRRRERFSRLRHFNRG